MKLFRRGKTAETTEEEKDAVPDAAAEMDGPEGASDAQGTPAQEETGKPEPEAADAPEEAAEKPPKAGGDLLSQISAETDSELAAEEAAAAGTSDDDALDPELMDIFRDPKNEVEEASLAADLENIPVNELLSDAIGVIRRLGEVPGGGAGGRAQPDDSPKP